MAELLVGLRLEEEIRARTWNCCRVAFPAASKDNEFAGQLPGFRWVLDCLDSVLFSRIRCSLRWRDNVSSIRRHWCTLLIVSYCLPYRFRQRLQGQRRHREFLLRFGLPGGKVYLPAAGGAVIGMPVLEHGSSKSI